MANKQNLSSYRVGLLLVAGLILGGCDYFKKKEEPPERPAAAAPAANGDQPAGKSSGRVPRGKLVTGSIDGVQVQLSSGEISEGIITLRQGEDNFSENKVMVFLFNEVKGSIPEGKKYFVAVDAQGSNPHVHYSAVEGEKHVNGAVTDGYKLELEFGKEGPKGKLPGRIELEIPSKNLKVAGKFVLDIKGFRIIDGKPDLTSDSFETLKTISQIYLEKQNAGKAIQVIDGRDGLYTSSVSNKPDAKQWGRYNIAYTIDGAQTNRLKLVYVKDPSGWAVNGTLEPSQIFEAHPVIAPTPDGTWINDYLAYVTAQRLESDLAASHAGQEVSDVTYQIVVDPSKQSAACTVAYKINRAEQPEKAEYALRLDAGKWTAEPKPSAAAATPPPSAPTPAPAPAEAPPPSAAQPPAIPETNAPTAQPPPPAVPETNAPPAAAPPTL